MPLDDTPSFLHWAAWWRYRPRRPKESPLWPCLRAHFYAFIQAYPEKYEKKYGFLKPVVEDVVNKYLDGGDLTKGFARIYCENCKESILLPFSCKGRWFCPSCQEKKVLLFGEFVTGTIAYPVPHPARDGSRCFPIHEFRQGMAKSVRR